MRQHEIILVYPNEPFKHVGLYRKTFILLPKKAVCYLSRSRKIHKTDEISEMKKFKFMPKKIQPAITCSKLTIETLEQGVKYVQS